MEPRLPYAKIAPDGFKAMVGLETYVSNSSIERKLAHLVKLRASQINGCAYCIDMHSRDLRAAGETKQRVDLLNAWDESTVYTPRERAALRWTEAVTRISETRAPEDAYREVCGQFSEKEVVDLTWLIAAINAWNRVSISFRVQPPPRSS